MDLVKMDTFLGFTFFDCNYENEHLQFSSPSEIKDSNFKDVVELYNQGTSFRSIEAVTGVPKSNVARWVKKIKYKKNINENEKK